MKLDGKALVAVAVMFGAMSATGCKKASEAPTQPEVTPVVLTPDEPAAGSAAPAASDAPVANSEAPAASSAAPVANGAAPAISDKLTMVASARTEAPPALREESPGRAPSAHHVWQRGYWRYDTSRTAYVWTPGFWEDTTVFATTAPPAVIYEDPGRAPSDEYFYAPGYWRYSGREYVWVYGHWSLRRDAGYYHRANWVRVNGRWEHRVERGNAARVASWERTPHRYDGRHRVPSSLDVRHHDGPRHASGDHHASRPLAGAAHDRGHAAPAYHHGASPAVPQHHPRASAHAPQARPAVHHTPAASRSSAPARAARRGH